MAWNGRADTGGDRIGGTAMSVEERLDIFESKLGILERIEAMLLVLVERQQREWYSVEEFARIVGRAEFTCREWARHGRIRAEKRLSGRGAFPAWAISHVELLRYQREGLLPLRQLPRGDAEAKCG